MFHGVNPTFVSPAAIWDSCGSKSGPFAAKAISQTSGGGDRISSEIGSLMATGESNFRSVPPRMPPKRPAGDRSTPRGGCAGYRRRIVLAIEVRSLAVVRVAARQSADLVAGAGQTLDRFVKVRAHRALQEILHAVARRLARASHNLGPITRPRYGLDVTVGGCSPVDKRLKRPQQRALVQIGY